MPPMTVFTHSIERDSAVYFALAYKRAALLYRHDDYGEPIDPDYAPFDSIHPDGRKDIEACHSGTMGNSRREDALVPVLTDLQRCIDEGSIGMKPIGPRERIRAAGLSHLFQGEDGPLYSSSVAIKATGKVALADEIAWFARGGT